MKLKLETRVVNDGKHSFSVIAIHGCSISARAVAYEFGGQLGGPQKSDGREIVEFESRAKALRFLNDCLLTEFPPRGE